MGVNQDGKEIRRSDYQGRKVVLYFYPKDNTSGCTAEACNLRDGYDALRAAGYEVVGVSKDSEASHRKFIEKQSLPFDLIADTDTSLNQTFGVWAEKKLYGRTYMARPAHLHHRRKRCGRTHYRQGRYQEPCRPDIEQ